MIPEIEHSLREALAIHEMFRRLHFEPEEIFLLVDKDNGIGILVASKPDMRGLTIHLLEAEKMADVAAASVAKRWDELVDRFNSDETFAMDIYTNALAPKCSVRFLAGLHTAGIALRGRNVPKLDAWKPQPTLLN